MPFSRKSQRTRNAAVDPPAVAINAAAKMSAPLCGLCGLCTDQQTNNNDSHHHRVTATATAANAPMKPQQRYLPKTTACTAATATSSRSLFSSSAATSSSSSSSIADLCPVTGVYANITDDYAIHPRIIGKGHYGSVRSCTHIATRRTFAVKTVLKSRVGRLDHLRREIYLLAQVDHHAIMKMVDCYEDAEAVHIITERYEGGELFDKIMESTNPTGCFTERRAAGVIRSLLEAVAYLHDAGVVHRDIKPENVLFESSSNDCDAVRLIDFGLSRRHDPRSEGLMSNPVGTAYYMSPELLRGQYDRSCDVWAVGVVTHILLAGYPPFNGSNDVEIQESTRRGTLTFWGSQWLSKSDDAVDFVRCLLRRDPRKRFTAREALTHPWIRKATSC